MRQGKADGVHGGRIEGILSGDGADAVGSKELLHELLFSVESDAVIRAESVPEARRARMV
jgi:hypothetical protein